MKSNESRFILSLGAGYNQIILIEAALDLGYQVIAVDRDALAPGFKLCTIRIVESISEYRKIWYRLQMLQLHDRIDAVLSRSFGIAQKSVSYLSEKFHLNGNRNFKLELFNDKDAMKRALVEADVPTPPFYQLSTINRQRLPADLDYPLIVKKKVSHGKQNLFFIKNSKSWQQIRERLTTSGKEELSHYIVEPYRRHNGEFTLMAYLDRGNLIFVDLWEKITSGPPDFIELEHRSPAEIDVNNMKNLHKKLQRACKKMGLQYGPLVVEFILLEKNEFQILEMVPEFGGEYLAEAMILRKPSFNIFQAVISSLIADAKKSPNVSKNFIAQKKDNVIIRFLIWEKKIRRGQKLFLKKIESPETDKEQLLLHKFFLKEGEQIRPVNSNKDRLGVFILTGTKMDKLRRMVRKQSSAYKFETTSDPQQIPEAQSLSQKEAQQEETEYDNLPEINKDTASG